jgi:uncharacterized membrane-anchored protein
MKRYLTLVALVVGQLALVAFAVAPQLSARTTGDEFTFRVQPIDPIEPGRGRYVQLGYPDLQDPRADWIEPGTLGTIEDGENGDLYVVIVEQDGVWVADRMTRTRPDSGTFMKCRAQWQIRCGIESLFVNENRAPKLEDDLADGAYATVRIDPRGNASVVDIREDL